MNELRCKKCGSTLEKQGETYICPACRSSYEADSVRSYTDELVRILDEQKQEAVANLRMQLWKAFNEENYDLEEIRRLAKGIKSYLPNDFFANFCDLASDENPRSLNKFLRDIDVVKYRDYVWDILGFLMRPLREKNQLAMNVLLARIREAELDIDKFNYYNKLHIKKSEELDKGVYVVTLPRDVFVAYSSEDMAEVEELVETLEEQNISCFVAARNLQHGAIQYYKEELKKAMDSCKTVVFVSSSNSRNRARDALTIELPYIKQKDIEAAPGVYRHDYEKMPIEYKKPRVEYLISEHRNTAGDRLVEEFFAGYEYCYDKETVAKRILEFIATPAMGNIKYCVACGAENAKRVKYCSECGGQEFVPTKEECEERQRIKQERALREAEAVRKAEEDRLRTEEEKKKVEAEAATLRAELERLKAEIGKTMTNADGDGVGVQAKKIEDKSVAQTETTYAKPSVAPYPKASPASDFIIKNGELRKYVGKGGGVVIPDGVTSIGDSAFGGCSSLTSITIPDSVTSIEPGAFSDCSSLTSITIPDSVTSIEPGAFSDCSGLTSITIPNGVTRIEWSAFIGCSGLTSITIPDSVTSIEGYAFSGCSGLTSITIPNGVTRIEWSAFSGCSGLTSITIPNSVTEIRYNTFKGCSGLTSIKVDKGNKKYHSAGNCLIETESKTLIAGCKNSVIPADGSVTSIGDSAFEGCSSLTSITIPDSVTSIGDSAFDGCSSLTSITIPNSVTSIGDWAFNDCSGLTSITVENGNKKYHSAGNCLIETKSKSLIAGCNNSIIPTDGSVTSIRGAFIGCGGLKELTIPNSIKKIERASFCDCGGLTSITIPNSVTSIEPSAFIDCSGLTSITVENGNKKYHSAGNCLIETRSKKLIAGCKNSVIPADGSVTSIDEWAFRGCSGLTSITIPNSVKSIRRWAFEGCSGLTSITIPDSVASIGGSAFKGCSSLTSITIPDSVTSIREDAFSGCSGLTSITIPDSVTIIGQRVFQDCSGLTSITIPNSVTEIGNRAFSGCPAKIYCHRKEPLEWPIDWDESLKGRIIWDK